MTFIYGKWNAVVTEHGVDGKTHVWNCEIDARDAAEAAEQALASYDPSRVSGIEVERA